MGRYNLTSRDDKNDSYYMCNKNNQCTDMVSDIDKNKYDYNSRYHNRSWNNGNVSTSNREERGEIFFIRREKRMREG